MLPYYARIVGACLLALLLTVLLVASCMIYKEKQGFLSTISLQDVLSIAEIPAISANALFINQGKHVGRRRHVETLLDDMGFLGRRVEPLEDEIPWKSLTATHRSCLEQVAALREPKYVCIFEDDVELVADVPREAARRYMERSLRDLYSETDKLAFVKLGACLEPKQEAACLPECCQSWCTHAYMLTPQAARHLLSISADLWHTMHADALYMQVAPALPLVGHAFTHDHTSPGWRGLFFQARLAPWYEAGMAEIGYESRGAESSSVLSPPRVEASSIRPPRRRSTRCKVDSF